MSKSPPLVAVAGTLPLPGTTPTPAVGEVVRAADIQMCAQGLLNQDATLEATKLSLAGGTMTGPIVGSGAAAINGTWASSATVSCTGGWQWSNSAAFSGLTTLGGRAVLRSARVAVADLAATKRLGVVAFAGTDFVGKRFALGASAATPRVRVLADAGPQEGECIEVLYGAGAAALPTGHNYQFQRQDGTVIASIYVTAIGSNALTFWIEFEYVGGVWRLGANSGASYDGAANVGIIPGAGA